MTIHLPKRLIPALVLLLFWGLPLGVDGGENETSLKKTTTEATTSPMEIGAGGNLRREDPYQSEAEQLRPVHVHFRWESRYVTEGRDNLPGDSLASVFSDISVGNFTFAPWLAHSRDREYTELDLNFVYGLKPADQLEVYAGYTYIHSRLTNDDASDNEVSLDVVYMPTALFDVLGSWYHSFEAGGGFWKVAVQRQQTLNARTVLTLRSGLGINDGYISQGHDGFNNVLLRLNLAYYPLPRLEVMSYAAYSVALNRNPDRFADDANLRDLFWAGIGVACHF